MAIADGNAERRNLTVLSLAIIVYFIAGARPTGQIGLPLVNVTFSNTYMLVTVVWMMLFWFNFRYWQENHLEGNDKINTRLRGFGRTHSPLIGFIRDREGHGKKAHVNVTISELKKERYGSAGKLRWIATFNVRNQNSQGSPGKARNFKFDDWQGKWSIIKTKLAMSRSEGCTWAYWMPYILATTAWLFGAYHAVIEVYSLIAN